MVKLGRASVINNVQYSLDYTKTTYLSPDTVFSIPIPAGKWRIISLGYSADSTATGQFVVKIHIDNAPFTYPTGTSEYNAPPLQFQLCGVVPTDYIDVEGGNNITMYSVMTGSATSDGNINLTMIMKQIIDDKTGND